MLPCTSSVYPLAHVVLSSAEIMFGGSGAAASEDAMAKLQRYVDKREQELECIQGQVAELMTALRQRQVVHPFEDAAEIKAELQRLHAKEASLEKLLQADKQRLLLLEQGAAGECTQIDCSHPHSQGAPHLGMH